MKMTKKAKVEIAKLNMDGDYIGTIEGTTEQISKFIELLGEKLSQEEKRRFKVERKR
jgi:hypothetical protein